MSESTIIFIVLVIILVIYYYAQDSNKETKGERFADGAGKFAHSVADSISGLAFSIAEPSKKRR